MSSPGRRRSESTGPRPLAILQRWFQAVITDPEGVAGGASSAQAQEAIAVDPGRLELVIGRSRAQTAAERLAVYANAYFARLLECLGELFPALRRALGDEVFNAFAIAYLERHPPHSHTLDKLGEDFPRFLAETRPDLDEHGRPPSVATWPDLLVDVARLELAIAEVFDGPGLESGSPLAASDLAELTAESFAAAHLQLAPCVRLLAFRYPVNAYYTALRRASDGDQVLPPEPCSEFVALTRRDYVVRRHVLSEAQYGLLGALAAGATVGDAIASAAPACGDPGDLAGRLHEWFAAWTAAPLFERVLAVADAGGDGP